jgi:hypothetical protein
MIRTAPGDGGWVKGVGDDQVGAGEPGRAVGQADDLVTGPGEDGTAWRPMTPVAPASRMRMAVLLSSRSSPREAGAVLLAR